MLRRIPLIALASAIALSACSQAPVPTASDRAPSPYRIQQQPSTDEEGANDASLDAIIRELDNEADQTATQSAVPMQSQNVLGFRGYHSQQAVDQDRDRDRGYGWYGGFGYGPYGYGIFARCQRIYRRCLNRAYFYYSGTNTYQFCRRVRNRCTRAQWIRS